MLVLTLNVRWYNNLLLSKFTKNCDQTILAAFVYCFAKALDVRYGASMNIAEQGMHSAHFAKFFISLDDSDLVGIRFKFPSLVPP